MTLPSALFRSRLSRWWTAVALSVAAMVLAPAVNAERPPPKVEAKPTSDSSPSPSSDASGSPRLRILAASSVSDVVSDVALQTVGLDRVEISAASSSTLARQALAGAPFDVFVSANRAWIEELTAAGIVDAPVVIARNSVAIAISVGSDVEANMFPRGPIAAAARHVPLGDATEGVQAAIGLSESDRARVVRAPSARTALEWVATGDAASGFLFRSDVLSDPRVKIAWALPPASNPFVDVVAAVRRESNPEASAFVRELAGRTGQAAFRKAHFGGDVAAASSKSQGAVPGAARQGAPSTIAAVDVGAAVRRSLFVAAFALALGGPLSVFAGYLLARRRRTGALTTVLNVMLSATLLVPLALPPVVTGWLLLVAFGNRGLSTGIPFTVWACVLAATVVAVPLLTLTSRAAFEAVDPRLEELALTLGVPPGRAFSKVTLPLAAPGLVAGALLAFARALGEYGATVVVAGNTEGTTRTLALAVEALLHAPAHAGAGGISTLVAFSISSTFVVVVAYELLLVWQRRRLGWSK